MTEWATLEEDKVNLEDGRGIPMRPLKNTLVLAVSFFSVYTAYLGIQNIQSSINQKEGLGVASLSCIHATSIFSSLLAPVYIHFVGIKTSVLLAFLIHCVYTGSNFFPDWGTLIPSSVLLGLTGAPLWIGGHLYINGMGQYDSKILENDLHGSLSRYNGIFFSFISSAQVAGNAISSVVLHHSQTDQFDLNQTSICGAEDCPGNELKTTKIVRPEVYVFHMLLGIYFGCGLIGFLVTAVFLRPLNLEKVDNKTILKKTLGCCKVFSDKKLLMLIPARISQAMNMSILLAGFTKAFVSCTVGVKMVGYVMMTYGTVSAVSAVSFGHVAKYSGRIPLMVMSFSIDIVALVFMLLWKPVRAHISLLFIIPCIWAVGDGIWASQFTSLVAISFPHTQPAIFSNLGTWGSIGFTFILASDQLFCLGSKLYLAISLSVLGLIGYLFLERTLIREAKDESSTEYLVITNSSKEVNGFDRDVTRETVKDRSSVADENGQ